MRNAFETPWVTLEGNDVPLSLCNGLSRPNLTMISWSSLLPPPQPSQSGWENFQHYLLPPLCLEASVFRKSRKSQPILKITNKKDNSGYLLGMEGGFTDSSPLHPHCP